MGKALERILYVEDEPDIRTIAVTVLQALGGFSVIACSSGQEAVDAATTADADLILLDVMMPGMDGPATLRALRGIARTAATPVVFMTAKVQPREIEQLRGLGALDVIAKPFDPMELSAELRELWRRHSKPPGPDAAAAVGPDVGLQSIYRDYAVQVPSMIANIDALWSSLRSGADPAAVKALHLALHSIAGSAGTFGLAKLGSDAKALELALEPYLGGGPPTTAELESLVPLLERIRAAGA